MHNRWHALWASISQKRRNPNKTRKIVLVFLLGFVPDKLTLQHSRYKNKGKSLYPGENRMNTGFEV